MLTAERQRKNKPTFIELQSLSNATDKDRRIQKLGSSLKCSIQNLNNLKTKILAENNINQVEVLLNRYWKQNKYFNELQDSLVEITETSPTLQNIKEMNKKFIESHEPQELQKKLANMRSRLSTRSPQQSSFDKIDLGTQSGDFLLSDKHAVRKRLLEEQKHELDQIQKMAFLINKIAQDTALMINEQGQKLQLAGAKMKKINKLFKQGGEQLQQATQYQQGTNKRLFAMCIGLVLIIVVIIMILYSTNKKKE